MYLHILIYSNRTILVLFNNLQCRLIIILGVYTGNNVSVKLSMAGDFFLSTRLYLRLFRSWCCFALCLQSLYVCGTGKTIVSYCKVVHFYKYIKKLQAT